MRNRYKEIAVPLLLTIITFLILSGVLAGWISLLNRFPGIEPLQLLLQPADIIIGMTIYLKTSIDFVIFIGNLMKSNPGWKKRIAIETGTAIGNATGTMFVLGVWFFFKEIPLLMILMVLIASLVLLTMAEEGLEIYALKENHPLLTPLATGLMSITRLTKPLLSKLIPEKIIGSGTALPFFKLFQFSFSIPFILGLDDFAGYIPLFSIVHVFGFSIGVLAAHMILNLALFTSPKTTTKLVTLPVVLIFGSVALTAIALFGFFDILQIGIHLFTR